MPEGNNYWTRARYGRRAALRGAGLGVAGLAGAALIGCGSDDEGGDGGGGDSGGGGAGTATSGGGASSGSVTLTPGIYEGAVEPSVGEADPAKYAKTGGTLQMRYLDPPRMDLNRTLSCTIYHTLNYTNNKLVRGNTGADAPLFTVEIEPDLAESWEDTDGTEFTFNLRKGVKTHNVEPVNGREFTSEDVVAAFEMYRAGGTQEDVFSPVTSIEAPDDYTVTVKLDQPLVSFPTNISSWSFIFLKELVDNDDLRQERAIGTGAFVQEEWTPKQRSVFKKHPDYFEEGLPYVDEVIAVVQNDVAAQRAAFQTDNLFMWAPRDDADAEAMFEQKSDTFVMSKFPTSRGANVNGFQFQMLNPIFQDDRVRQALCLGIDRVSFDDADNAGDNANPEGPYSNAPMPWPYLFDEYPTAKANGKWYQFNAEEASKMLQAAGYTSDSPLSLELQTFYYDQELSTLVIPGLNQTLPEVDISFRKIDNPTHVTLMSDRNFDELIGFLWGPPGYSMDQWIYPFYHSEGGLNYGSINDPDLDAMLVKQRQETDQEAKKEVWNQIYDRIHDKVYQAWLPEARRRYAWHNYMQNFRTHGLMGSYLCYASDQARAIWLEDGAPTVDR